MATYNVSIIVNVLLYYLKLIFSYGILQSHPALHSRFSYLIDTVWLCLHGSDLAISPLIFFLENPQQKSKAETWISVSDVVADPNVD